MSQTAETYGQALYSLALEENLTQAIADELAVLRQSFADTPEYLRLLSSPSLTKQERCRTLDAIFQGKVQPYLLNFLKLMTEKGCIRYFDEACKVYTRLYDRDNHILPVTVVTALPLPQQQADRLTQLLAAQTGKTIRLECRVDGSCIGGIRLEYDGKLVEDTIVHRLETVGKLLKNTVI